MANDLNGCPSPIGPSGNMKIPNAYRYRPPRFSNIKNGKFFSIKKGTRKLKDISTSNTHIKNSHILKNPGYKLLIMVMLMTLLIVIIPSFLGFRFEVVRSGSMSPALDTGSLVITGPVNPYSIEIGDVIAYHPPSNPDTLIIHRVIGIDNDNSLSFLTKGDASKSTDAALIPAGSVVGNVKLDFPWIGYLVGFAKSTAGFLICLVIPGIIILYMEFNKLWTLVNPKGTERTARSKFDNPILSSFHGRNPSAFVPGTAGIVYKPYERSIR